MSEAKNRTYFWSHVREWVEVTWRPVRYSRKTSEDFEEGELRRGMGASQNFDSKFWGSSLSTVFSLGSQFEKNPTNPRQVGKVLIRFHHRGT